MSITYTGIAEFGVDYGGLFGAKGASLVGDAVSESFVFDTNKGQNTSGGQGAALTYDPVFTPGYDQPLISTTLTVGGISFQLPVTNLIRSTFNEADVSGFSRVYTGYYYNNGSTDTELGSTFWNQTVPINLSQGYYSDQPGQGAPNSGGSVVSVIINDNYATLVPTETSLQFTPASVEISSAVPEPATWAMMLLGFAGLGLGVRARKKSLI